MPESDYEDIIIPVPYDPRIPGLRCEDIQDEDEATDDENETQL